MDRKVGLSSLVWLFVGVASLELYSLFPLSTDLRMGFPFDGQRLTYQTYFDYLGTRLAICILLWRVYLLMPKYREQVFIFLVLAAGYVIDYVCIYNDPFAITYVFGIRTPVSYTLFMIVAMIYVILKTYFDEQWKT